MRIIPWTIVLLLILGCGQNKNGRLETNESVYKDNKNRTMKTITVEIWSDVVCPFCYIGKRKFENALNNFEHADRVEVVWKSFQLNPYIKSDSTKNAIISLAESKGISLDEARGMSDYVVQMAQGVGLNFIFESAKTANTLNAHRFIHLAKKHGKQAEAKEHLLKAYFLQGRFIDELGLFLELGEKLDIERAEIAQMFESDQFVAEVKKDIQEAQAAGVRGVPHFRINGTQSISGAQDSEVFLKALKRAAQD